MEMTTKALTNQMLRYGVVLIPGNVGEGDKLQNSHKEEAHRLHIVNGLRLFSGASTVRVQRFLTDMWETKKPDVARDPDKRPVSGESACLHAGAWCSRVWNKIPVDVNQMWCAMH